MPFWKCPLTTINSDQVNGTIFFALYDFFLVLFTLSTSINKCIFVIKSCDDFYMYFQVINYDLIYIYKKSHGIGGFPFLLLDCKSIQFNELNVVVTIGKLFLTAPKKLKFEIRSLIKRSILYGFPPHKCSI